MNTKSKVSLSFIAVCLFFTNSLLFAQDVSQNAYKNSGNQPQNTPPTNQSQSDQSLSNPNNLRSSQQPQIQQSRPPQSQPNHPINQDPSRGDNRNWHNNRPVVYNNYYPVYVPYPTQDNNAPIYIFDQYGRSINNCPTQNISFTQITDIYGNVIRWNETCVL